MKINILRKTALNNAHQEFIFKALEETQGDLQLAISSITPLLERTVRNEKKKIPVTHSIKVQISIQLAMEKYSFDLDKTIFLEPWFSSDVLSIISQKDKISSKLRGALNKCVENFETFVHTGSGWVLKKVILFKLLIMRFKHFSGGCCFGVLPPGLERKRGIISIRISNKNQCFLMAVVSCLLKETLNVTRVKRAHNKLLKYLPREFEKFPIMLKDIQLFERKTNISVNVFGFEKSLFPFYITDKEHKFHVNLLNYGNHYFGIKKLSNLLPFKKNTRKKYICNYCLSYFIKKERYDTHVRLCKSLCQPLRMPKVQERYTKFKAFHSLIPAPFVIYADVETIVCPEKNIMKGKVKTERNHEPISVAAYTVCYQNDLFSSHKPFCYTGEDCILQFFNFLDEEVVRICHIIQNVNIPIIMNSKDWDKFNEAKECFMCKIIFNDNVLKVRDHCHLTGAFRNALCSLCNLSHGKTNSQIHVVFHGLNNYDQHFIISNLSKRESQIPIRIVPYSSEKFISFTIGNLCFKDSFCFLNSSLANLVSTLKTKGEHCFYSVNKFFSDNKRKLLYRKGVFPYNYMSDKNKLNEKQLPPREAFFNDLTKENISEDDYEFAQKVWLEFDCVCIKDYLEIYLLADVFLLADIFENFRQTSISNYDLDPVHFLTNAQYALNAFLRKTQSELELLTDINMYLFFKKAIRGGVSMSVKRFAKANNKYMPNHDKCLPSSFISYLDCNNLYGKAMLEYLPCSNFEWKSPCEKMLKVILETPFNSNIGYMVECTLEYPSKLHDIHNDYPLAPTHLQVLKTMLSPMSKNILDQTGKKSSPSAKLVCSFLTKENYILHYRCLQLYVQLGLHILKVHNILSFYQKPVFKEYIIFNTVKRTEATNDFDINYFKLMSNSVFGKTIERADKRSKITLVSDIKKYEKGVANLNFKSAMRINKDLVSLQLKYSFLKCDKPIYLGTAILDLAKFFMYNFHYNVMMKYFPLESIHLMYTDTDSLVYHIFTDDIYQDFLKLQNYFDFSNYSSDHILFSNCKKKVPGFFKDETKGQIISSFVTLKAKMYAFQLLEKNNSISETKVAKGVHRSVISKNLMFYNYLDCLFSNRVLENSFSCIKSKSHRVFSSFEDKVSLSSFDDKRYMISCIKSLPYGHKNIMLRN